MPEAPAGCSAGSAWRHMLEVPMGMEISSRRLQEADSRMQAEREGADRPVDDRD